MTPDLPSPRRAALAAFIGALLVSAAIVAWIQGSDREREREQVEAITRDQARSLASVVERSFTVAYALGALVRQGGGEIADYEGVAGEMLAYFPSISVLALSPDGVIRQTAPFEPNRASIGFDQFADPIQGEEARRARDSGQLTVAGPLELVQGGLGVVARLPVYLPVEGAGVPAPADPGAVPDRGDFWGLVNVVLPLDRVVEESGLQSLPEWGLAFELWRTDPSTGARQVIASRGTVPPGQAVSREINLPNGTWTLSTFPEGGWGATAELLRRGAGALLFALLAGWVAHLLTSLGNHRRRLQDEVERRTAEIREARNQLEGTLAAIPDLLFEVQIDGRFLEVHARRPELLIAPRSDLIGTRIQDWLPPEATAVIQGALRDAELHGWSVGRQYALDLEHGVRWFELSVARKAAADGGLPTFMVLARDVTARRAADEALRESEARYLQAQKMESVGRLAGGVAHDFNNLLTVIRGAADMAAEALPGHHAAQEDLAQIRASAARGAALTQQLLGTSSQQVIRPEQLELNQLVEELLDLVRRMIGTDIQVSTDLADTPLWIRADRNQLSQVFLNLAANARDAMPSGGTLAIRTRLEKRGPDEGDEVARTGEAPGLGATGPGGGGSGGGWVRLAFEDSGHGIPPEVRERIFEPFFTTKARGRGSGLGLATVYGIVRQIGGDIKVESEAGEGTRFDLWIPGAPAPTTGDIPSDGDSGSMPPALAEDPSPAADPDTRPHRILLVDDEPAILRLAQRSLERAGYEVRSASRGEEALALLEGDDPFVPDALVTDVVMPGMNGVELALRIRQRSTIPVLFTSGFTDHPALTEGALPALSTFVPKPYDAPLLQRELARLLHRDDEAPSGSPLPSTPEVP